MKEFRGILIYRFSKGMLDEVKIWNEALSEDKIKTDMKEPTAIESAKLTNEFTEKSPKILKEAAVNKKRIQEGKLPANLILSRDAGDSLPKFPKIKDCFGVSFGSFVEMPVERGIALLTGMQVVDVPSASGHLDVDYGIWAKIASKEIEKFDGLYIHIKGPDEPAHDGDFKKKKKIIQLIDKFFFAKLLSKIKLEDTIITVTADHSTPCSLKAHSADPVPILVCGGSIQADSTSCFSEKEAKKGSIGKLLGKDIMPLLVKFAKE